MKKFLTLIILSLFFVSCDTNIKTIKDNPDIPFLVQSNAEQTASLSKDSVSKFLLYEVEEKSYIYQYNIANKKAILLNKIQKYNEAGSFMFVGFIIGIFILLIVMTITSSD